MQILTIINKYYFLFFTLVQRQFILRYRRTFLGYIWAVLNPLFSLAIMTIVFSSIFGQDPKVFAVFLFSGMTAFNLFSASILISSTTFMEHEGLITKVYIPKIILPLTVCFSALLDSILVFIALLIIMFILGSPVTMTLLVLPLSFLLLFIFSIGLALLSALATIFYRDLQQIIPYGLQALFFLSPILYPKKNFSDPLMSFIMDINPISVYVDLFRGPIFESRIPDLSSYTLGLAYAIISITVGTIIFSKFKHLIIYKV